MKNLFAILFAFAMLWSVGFLQAQTMDSTQTIQLGVQEDGYFRQVDFEALAKSSNFGGLQ